MNDPYLYPGTEVLRVHPFREGNTRTTITFFCDFADKMGFSLNRELFKDNAAYVRRALVAASANLKGYGDYSKPEYIESFICDAIESSAAEQDNP
jgi:cell filamentation protein